MSIMVRSLSLSPPWREAGTGPAVPESPVGQPTATRTSVGERPLLVAPPLSPVHTGAHGTEYSENVCRGGFPKPKGQDRAVTPGGGAAGGATVPAAPAPTGAPGPLPSALPAVPPCARLVAA